MQTRTMLIDASRLFREGLRRLLEGSGFEICSEATTLGDGLAVVGETDGLELVLVELPNEDRPDLGPLRDLREQYPDIKIVALASKVSMTALARGLDAGIHGYLLKDISPEGLIQSLRLVGTGEKVFPTTLADLLVRGDVRSEGILASSSIEGLSEREVQILRCLVSGLSNKGIANRLHITEATVKVHLKSLLKKIRAQNRTQAAIWAVRHGLGAEAGFLPDGSVGRFRKPL